ncbi:MAG TPA: tetraacyldisaccharide 4'-kinase [Candidatus Acidoferrum sp.]|jgi:tetraacyldisaccharide 4'-kinase
MNWPLLVRLFLWPYSVVYGAAVRLHAWLYQQGVYPVKRLSVPVVSVGNLTVGGTGKTPMVLWLAERFLSEKKHVAILSRGYRGSSGTSDEIEMLKSRLGNRVAFGVGPDRHKEGLRLQKEYPIDIFLLDDGFQHQELARDVDIVLVDSTRPLHREHLIPAGRLREPISAMLRASVVVFTRVQQAPFVAPATQKFPRLPIFPASTELSGFKQVFEGKAADRADNLPQPAFAFCGIGNPEAFFADLERWHINVVGRSRFRDHHPYSDEDVQKISKSAKELGAVVVLTTEKDLQNLANKKFSLPLYCCEIALDIPDSAQFWKVITQLLPANTGPSL